MNKQDQKMMQAGWAHGDITPRRKTLVQGQFHTRISDQVVSPLTATVLVLEGADAAGQTEQAILISCDLSQDFLKEDLCRALSGRCDGLDYTKITVNATHTHNAPCQVSGWYDEPENDPDFMKPEEYRLWLISQVSDLVETAWNGRQPTSVSRGFSYAVVGRCRRAVYADGSAAMYGESERADFRGFESCDDHAVNQLYFHNAAGALTGMIINVACPSQSEEHGSFFSSDFWHPVREGVAARYGADVYVLPQCGVAGDMSPHLMTLKSEEADLRARLGVVAKEIIARRILSAVEEGMSTASAPETEVVFTHTVANWELRRMKVTREEYELEKRIPEMTEEDRARQHYAFQRLWPFGPVCELISRYEQQGEHPVHDVECHIVRIGDTVIATNPFELFVDYGHQIRSRSRALQTILVQLGDGSDNGFYLPTQRAIEGGHYSAQIKSCWVGPEGGQQLVENTVAAINSLFEGADYPKTR